ncbi:hypothetical protein IT570_11985 [Candidatus Sumerlaeota bacterium]|nr:hypothetical protein [Candidatus Sumerlaeota bacterium]
MRFVWTPIGRRRDLNAIPHDGRDDKVPMRCFARTFGFLVLLALPSGLLAVPAVWLDSDLPRQPRQWYSVKAVSLPTGSPLAASIERGLLNSGWSPVEVKASKSETAVFVGRTDRVGDALYLMEELRQQNVADGEVVAIPAPSDHAVAMTGDFQAPFTTGSFESKRTEEEMRNRIRSIVGGFPEDRQEAIRGALDAWEKRQYSNPQLAVGMMEVATFLWNQKTDIDIVQYIASRIAPEELPGLWVTGDEQRAVKVRAQNLMFECMETTDWRGAWEASKMLEKFDLSSPVARSTNLVRQALMLVDAPKGFKVDYSEVREYLHRAWDAAPPENKRIRARIEVVYMLTFAWEGNWGRVDKLSSAIKAEDAGDEYAKAMAMVYHAISRTRYRFYDEALAELDTVIFSSTLSEADLPRRGTETMDPVELAKSWRDKVRKQEAEARLGIPAPPVATPAAAAAKPTR